MDARDEGRGGQLMRMGVLHVDKRIAVGSSENICHLQAFVLRLWKNEQNSSEGCQAGDPEGELPTV